MASTGSLHLEVISPARVLSTLEATAVMVPGALGYMTILPGHTPMISELSVGEIRAVEAGGVTHEFFVSGGYVEADNTRVMILADIIERPKEIDLPRANKARDRAKERLKDVQNDLLRAQAALKRSEARITFATKHRSADPH